MTNLEKYGRHTDECLLEAYKNPNTSGGAMVPYCTCGLDDALKEEAELEDRIQRKVLEWISKELVDGEALQWDTDRNKSLRTAIRSVLKWKGGEG